MNALFLIPAFVCAGLTIWFAIDAYHVLREQHAHNRRMRQIEQDEGGWNV